MESWLPWVIQLISGAAGGLGAGKVLKNQSLGTIGDAISGVVGGGIGGVIINVLAGISNSGGLSAANIGTDVASGGVGGAVVMVIVGLIKKAMGK
ncbi:MAG: hypothetical protein KA369_09400 [Spirochaetes bacterium]|nr:hypothetical protein [Spirochaetota bacterium]